MGLNAVVYKRLSELPEDIRGLARLVDPISGELEYADAEVESRYPSGLLFALDIFLGNVSMIGWVSKTLQDTFPGRERPLLEDFLVSGSQSGSVIPLTRLAAIEADLEELKEKKPQLDKDVRDFVESVTRLVSHARRHSNAIVFM